MCNITPKGIMVGVIAGLLAAILLTSCSRGGNQAAQDRQAPATGQVSPVSTQAPNFCSECGTKLPPGAKFYPGCGKQVAAIPALPPPAAAAPAEKPAYGTTITFSKIVLNGQQLDADAPVLKVDAGRKIFGVIEMKVDRQGPATSIFPVAGTVSWDRSERVTISEHLPPGQHHVSYELSQSAPNRAGTYWILLSAGPLYNINEILGCNHEPAHGGPANGPYGLGNSVWDWNDRQFEAAFTNRPVPCIWNGPPGNWALARAIKVIVTE